MHHSSREAASNVDITLSNEERLLKKYEETKSIGSGLKHTNHMGMDKRIVTWAC